MYNNKQNLDFKVQNFYRLINRRCYFKGKEQQIAITWE